MTIDLFQAEFEALWQTDRCSDSVTDRVDILRQCPQHLGRGYERRIRLQNINILIVNEQFHQDLSIEIPVYKTTDCVEFGFNLSGTGDDAQTSLLQWTVAGEIWDEDVETIAAGDRSLKVDIHIHPEYLQSLLAGDLSPFPPKLQQLMDGTCQEFFWEDSPLTAEMQSVLHQILHCRFSGMMEHIYLEGKCLELIALKLDRLAQANPDRHRDLNRTEDRNFQPEEIEQIDLARKLLISDLRHPPSLLNLARQVGLNDFKLRQGFRQLFGTTVFGYLHHYRMLQAKQLLELQHLSIGEVADAIGYNSRSAFYTAFKKKFGVSPSNYLG